MIRTRGVTHGQAASALCLCVLVVALVGATLHDADHAFDEGDVPCSVCLTADRPDSAATAAATIPATRLPDVIVDVRPAAVSFPARIAKGHGPRAPPFIG